MDVEDEYEVDGDTVVTVCGERTDGSSLRKDMKVSDYLEQLDFSKQYQLCSNRACGHDIEMHAAVKDPRAVAGKCGVHGCKCRKYWIGKLTTQRELDGKAPTKTAPKGSWSKDWIPMD